jgi:hypothetical protein
MSEHIKRNCHNRNRSFGQNKVGVDIVCYGCGRQGHIRRNCCDTNKKERNVVLREVNRFYSSQPWECKETQWGRDNRGITKGYFSGRIYNHSRVSVNAIETNHMIRKERIRITQGTQTNVEIKVSEMSH